MNFSTYYMHSIFLPFPLRRMNYNDQTNTDISAHYHIGAYIKLKGNFNEENFYASLNATPILFDAIAKKFGHDVVKHVCYFHLQYLKIRKDFIDFSKTTNPEQEALNWVNYASYDDFVIKDNNIPYYETLIKINENEHWFFCRYHNVITNELGLNVFFKFLAQQYKTLQYSKTNDIQFLTYFEDINNAIKHLNVNDLEINDSYWKNRIKTIPANIFTKKYDLPDKNESAKKLFVFDLSVSDQHELVDVRTLTGLNIKQLVFAALAIYFGKITENVDFIFGLATTKKELHVLSEIVLHATTTIPYKINFERSQKLSSFLKEISAAYRADIRHQNYSLQNIINNVTEIYPESANNILFEIVITDSPTNYKLDFGSFIESDMFLIAKKDELLPLEICLIGFNDYEKCKLQFNYDSTFFNEDDLGLLSKRLIYIIKQFSNMLDESIADINILPEEEGLLLKSFNNTQTSYPKNKTIIDVFKELVIHSPNAIALIFEGEELSYKLLDERSNKLAYYLATVGVKDGMLVPVCINRSTELLVAILGILKVGAAYVPIDPEYPQERIDYILADTSAKIIVTNNKTKQLLKYKEGTDFVVIDDLNTSSNEGDLATYKISITSQSLAYIIYTSGSTGKPKGAMVEHGNVVSLVKEVNYVNLSQQDVILATGSPSFDATTFEYWGALLNGGKLIICSEKTLLDNKLLKKEINDYKVTKMWFTSSWFNQLVESDIDIFKNLHTILVGGEKLSENHIFQLRNLYPAINIINGYGPTENTTFSLTYHIKETVFSGIIPIGKPLSNRTAYIVNKYAELMPIGVAGEILLGGAGVAKGYLNKPELTNEKFVVNNFDTNGTNLYRSGDLGMWMPNGMIQYIRRIDNQVKIRGYRIELEEVENAMNKLDHVKTSCVVAKSDGNSAQKLVCYYIADPAVIKAKERELFIPLVASWKELYETEYAKTESDNNIDVEFNIVGWNDSFTGQPISAEHMRDWLKDIVQLIMAEKPVNVLEIGSGTGLIYYQLANKIKKYIGTDFSKSSINQIQQQIDKSLNNYCPTQLHVCAAHEVALKADDIIDTVILNSIIQYFPGEEYLTDVIKKSIALLKNNGRIIIGDVRDNRMLALFKLRLQLKKLQQPASIEELKWLIEQEVLKEEELCLSPDYFYQLKTFFPEISHVEIRWKEGLHLNELTLYRFNVIIYVGINAPVIAPNWINWEDIENKESVFPKLKQGELVAIKNVPNPRFSIERVLYNNLQNKAIATVADISKVLNNQDHDLIAVNDFVQSVIAGGYNCRYLLNENLFNINIVFEAVQSAIFIQQPYIINESVYANSNTPLYADINALLQKEIKLLLQQSLPSYMVPSEIISLLNLPLNKNGKVARDFLSKRQERSLISTSDFKAPQNQLQQELAEIWQQLLGIAKVGINDDFFEMGGHSLLAMRLVSSINKQLTVELNMNDLFLNSTINKLSDYIQSKNGTSTNSTSKYASLLPIKRGENKIPLYMVCGGGGTVFKFKEFADLLDPDQAVYGLQQPTNVKDIGAFPDSIEGIAKLYVEEILTQNADGPYAITGHCLGGIIAFEMAKQLELKGKEVKLLAMFDTILGERENFGTNSLKNLYNIPAKMKKYLSEIYLKFNFETYLLRKYTKFAIGYKLHKLKLFANKIEAVPQNTELELFKKLERNYLKAYNNYDVTYYNKEIIVFYAKEHYYFWDKDNNVKFKRLALNDDTKNLWNQFAKAITMYEVDGEHSTIFYANNAKKFAHLLQQHINKCYE